jgi:DNA-binding NtrC family response regulator
MISRPLHLLIADDDHPYCVMLRKTFQTRGHSVVICNSGEETLKCLQEEPFDVVLLDYKMEGTNGINVLQWMYGKKIEIPAILITGHDTDDIYEEAFKWGAAEYFIKGEMDTVRLPVMVEQLYIKYHSLRNISDSST